MFCIANLRPEAERQSDAEIYRSIFQRKDCVKLCSVQGEVINIDAKI